MALDLGELVGSLVLDSTPMERALSRGNAALDTFASAGAAAAEDAGKKIGAELGDGAKAALSTLIDTLPRTARGAISRTSDEFRALEPALRKAVDEAEAQARFEKLPAEARQAMTAAEAELRAAAGGAAAAAAAAGDEAGSRFSDEFRQQVKDAGKVAGIGAGAALSAGVIDNIDVDAGRRRLSAQLGLSQADAKVAGDLAGRVYSGNFGGSLGEVNDAVASVLRNTNLQLGSVDVQPAVEKVLTLADVFEQDLGMTTAAAGQLVRTGVAKDISEALDIITVGLQGPANKADDLLETFNEYAVQFDKIGLDGATSLGLLTQSVVGGARDADIAGDALKEFSLKSVGSLATLASDGTRVLTDLGVAFEVLGLDGYKMQDDIAAGGDRAAGALNTILDRLRVMPDGIDKSTASVALFGTQGEDTAKALLAMDVSKAADSIGEVGGAADEVSDKVGGGAQATIETYRRKLIDMGRSAVESTGPTAAVAGAVAAFGPAVIGALGPIATLVAARAVQTAAAGTAATAETVASGAVVRGWIMSSAASTAGALKMAASWVIAMGPIGLVIAAVVGLGVLIYTKWDEIKAWTKAAWDWIVDKVKAVPGAIVSFFMNWTLVGLVIKHWDDLKSGVITKGTQVVEWVKDLPGKIVARIAVLGAQLLNQGRESFQRLRDGAEDKATALMTWVSGIPGRVVSNIGAMGRLLLDKGRDVIDGLRDGVEARWEGLRDYIGGVPERIVRAVGNVGNLLSGVGKDIVQGLANGISNAWDAVKRAVEGIINRIPGPIRKAMGIASPSRVMHLIGTQVVDGLILGLDDKVPDLRRSVTGITADLVIDAPEAAAMVVTATSGTPAGRRPGYSYDYDDGSVPPGPTPATAAPRGGDTFHIYETTDAAATAAEVSRRQAFAGAGR